MKQFQKNRQRKNLRNEIYKLFTLTIFLKVVHIREIRKIIFRASILISMIARMAVHGIDHDSAPAARDP